MLQKLQEFFLNVIVVCLVDTQIWCILLDI